MTERAKVDSTEETFIWAKDKKRPGGWLVRGPDGFEGDEVTVTKKNGDGSRVTLGKCIWRGKSDDDDPVALYKVRSDDDFDDGGSGCASGKGSVGGSVTSDTGLLERIQELTMALQEVASLVQAGSPIHALCIKALGQAADDEVPF